MSDVTAENPVHWADAVGSMLRPPPFVEAKESFPEGSFADHCRATGRRAVDDAPPGHEHLARGVFPDASSFDVFHIELDDERAGPVEPLRHLPEDKMAVPGLISAKCTKLEEQRELEGRTANAAEDRPLERRTAAAPCGLDSTAKGRKVTEQALVEKQRLVPYSARPVWGNS